MWVGDPVIKICFGPPIADFWSVWSSQTARKFRQIQPTKKVPILTALTKNDLTMNRSLCFQRNI